VKVATPRTDAAWEQAARTESRAEVLLEAMAALVETAGRATNSGKAGCANSAPRGALRPPVQIHVHRYPDCGRAEAAGRSLGRADAERVQCDSAVASSGRRNSATVPPRTRRAVLARDRHQCQAPGCGRRRFLEVHHVVPRTRGGTNGADNLVTLCSACHRLQHERGAGRDTRGIWLCVIIAET
jgi:5-methylcytosine-specific restriction endonuclease McrA